MNLHDVLENTKNSTPITHVCRGMIVRKSRYYRGRYSCFFYGPTGMKIKNWVREQFGDDDMIYANETTSGEEDCMGLITEQQLMIVKLRWL